MSEIKICFGAVIRDKSLIINLPGQPKSIQETLEGLKDASGASIVNGIFAAVLAALFCGGVL